jgi:hypothetical protein
MPVIFYLNQLSIRRTFPDVSPKHFDAFFDLKYTVKSSPFVSNLPFLWQHDASPHNHIESLYCTEVT